MAIVVLKFGETSVATVEKIKSIAGIIATERHLGSKIAVVVSAMAGVTDQLVRWVHDSVKYSPDPSEYNVVVSAGEQVTCGLIALALQNINIPARSWLAWQLPILTSDACTEPGEIKVVPDKILEDLNQGGIAIVAGFQGIDNNQRITTLGRGGSDVTAIALAHAIKAERCDIYTDADGIFTVDPSIVKSAQKFNEISYGDMLKLAQQGAKVLQPYSIEMAMRDKVRVRVLSSFTKGTGTWIVDNSKEKQNSKVIGITKQYGFTKIILKNVLNQTNLEKKISYLSKKENISVGMISKRFYRKSNVVDLVLSISGKDKEIIEKIVKRYKDNLKFESKIYNDNYAHISIVFNKINSSEEFPQKISNILKKEKIYIHIMSEFNSSINLLLAEKNANSALKILHQALVLDHQQNNFSMAA